MTDLALLLDRYKKGCIADPARILQSARLEWETSKSYSGREVLELVQNSIDAIEVGGTIKLVLDKNILRIHNSGKPFDLLGMEALIYGSMSSKFEDENTIGNKGLGLRSLLNISDKFCIYSNDFNVEFSENAKTGFLAKLREYDSVKSYERDFHMLETSVFASPLEVDPKYSEWACTIEVQLLPDTTKTVAEELAQLAKDSAVVVGVSEKIGKLDINGKIVTRADVEKENTIIWHPDKDVCLIIPKDVEKRSGSAYWYTYFPTKDSLPINGCIHALFELDSTRNHVNATSQNSKLKKKALKFYLNTVADLYGAEFGFERYKRMFPERGMSIPDYSYDYYEILLANDGKLYMPKTLHRLNGVLNEYLPFATLAQDDSVKIPDFLLRDDAARVKDLISAILTDENRAVLCKGWTDNFDMYTPHPDFLKGYTRVGPNVISDPKMMPDWLKADLMKEYSLKDETEIAFKFSAWGIQNMDITLILDNADITATNVEQVTNIAYKHGYMRNMKFLTACGKVRDARECYLNFEWSRYNVVKHDGIPDEFYISCGCNTKLRLENVWQSNKYSLKIPLDWDSLREQPVDYICKLLVSINYRECQDNYYIHPLRAYPWYEGKKPSEIEPSEIEEPERFELLQFLGMRQLTLEDMLKTKELERTRIFNEISALSENDEYVYDRTEEAAKEAELIAKAYLEKHYTNVKWYSRVLLGTTEYDHLGYDASYEDGNGETHYVEVKSAKEKAYISTNEIDVLSSYGNKAHIYFVRRHSNLKICDFS